MPDPLEQELSQETVDRILERLRAIEAELPMLVGLGPREKQRAIKAGRRTLAFISKIVVVAKMIEPWLPRNFDLETARQRLDRIERLSRL